MVKDKLASNIIDIMKKQGISLSEDDEQNIQDGFEKTIPFEYLQMARTCNPDDCEHSTICPLIKIGKAPEAHKCPIDIATIDMFYEEILNMLKAKSIQMDFSLSILIHDLIFNKLTLSRMESIISDEGYFAEIPIPLDREGSNIEYIAEESKAYIIRNQVVELTIKLYKLLGIDRYNEIRIKQLNEDYKYKKSINEEDSNGVNKFNEHMAMMISAFKILNTINEPKLENKKTIKRKNNKKKK